MNRALRLFAKKVEIAAERSYNGTACWEWVGQRNKKGYGKVRRDGRDIRAHRWIYEQAVGRIPDGWHIDHLCKNPPCVNPAHLEAVPPEVNNARSNSPSAVNARKTHCKNGHEFTPENTHSRPDGARRCHSCLVAHWHRTAQKRKSNK